MNRRGFLTGLLAAPVLVRASSLEYVPRQLIAPQAMTVHEVALRQYTLLAEHARFHRLGRTLGESLFDTFCLPSELLQELPMRPSSHLQLRYGSVPVARTHIPAVKWRTLT